MGKFEIVNRLKKQQIDGDDLLRMYEDKEISEELYYELSQDYPPSKDYRPSEKVVEETKLSKQSNVGKLINDLDLGSNIYSNIAIIFLIIYASSGIIFGILLRGFPGFTFALIFLLIGIFLYLSISWFGRVLKGLEQNNKLLKEILKK